MNAPQIPVAPNTQNELTWTVEKAASFLKLERPLDRATLSRLGKDCSLVARVWKRPTGVVPVVGKAWPSEKSYTKDVLMEAFRRHPVTRDYVPQEVQS